MDTWGKIEPKFAPGVLAIIKTWLISVSEGGFASKAPKNIASNIVP